MKILFTGGGTLGPVTPLLAMAEELNAKCKMQNVKCELVWIGTRQGPERKLVEDAGIKYGWIWAPKWRRYFDVRNLLTPLALHLATKMAWFKLFKMRPDVIITAGGFVGVPVVWAAWWLHIFGMRIPVLLHNQDVRWSLANKLVAPFVQRITYALPGTVPARWKYKAVWTGNPVRELVLNSISSPARVFPPLPEGGQGGVGGRGGSNDARPTILVIGGGTGAKRLNEIVGEALPELTKKYQVIHITGRGKQSTSYVLPTTNYRALEFVTNEIADLYAAADLVITRAGMGVLSELAALGKPMIIVPIPGTHQEDNARYFEKSGAAIVLDQRSLDDKKLTEAIGNLFGKLGVIQTMSNRARDLSKSDAAAQVAKEALGLAKA